jgi:hypothetical protein
MKTITVKRILDEVKYYDEDFVGTKEIKATLNKAMNATDIEPGYLTDIMEVVFGHLYDDTDIYEICKNICL